MKKVKSAFIIFLFKRRENRIFSNSSMTLLYIKFIVGPIVFQPVSSLCMEKLEEFLYGTRINSARVGPI